jgi:hypothetical protein
LVVVVVVVEEKQHNGEAWEQQRNNLLERNILYKNSTSIIYDRWKRKVMNMVVKIHVCGHFKVQTYLVALTSLRK